MGQTEAPQKPPSLAWSQRSILYLFTRTIGAAPPSGTSQEPVRDPERAGAQPADERLPAAAESLTPTSPSPSPGGEKHRQHRFALSRFFCPSEFFRAKLV